jgi:sulfonate transport system substrate-binding protein
VRSIEGAMESLSKNETQIFYWEKYMTRAFVEKGIVRMIGEFSAPWSSMLIIASDDALKTKRDAIQKVLEVINLESMRFVAAPDSVRLLQERFKLSEADATTWLHATVWSSDYTVRLQGLENAKEELVKIGSVDAGLNVADLCDANLSLT